jgi:glycosyltransferase involved in cell wall biosynthesis
METELEVIVVNDGSTDSSEEIITKYEHVIRYYKTENRGVSAARNLGYVNSTGDYIQYLDSDDLLESNKIDNQLRILQKTNADVVFGNYMRFNWFNGIRNDQELIMPEIISDPILESFDGFWCPPAAILYTKSICEKIGTWNEKLPVIQDARYIFDAAWNGAKFVKFDGVVAYYHVGSATSLSTKNELAFVKDCFNNAKDIKALWQTSMTHKRKQALIKSFRYCINEFSKLQPSLVDNVIDEILNLDPSYIPEQGRILHYLSKLLGYRKAEHIAIYKRRLLSE